MQLQLTYDPGEDRLLLSLGLAERSVSFWLTRRMTPLLWQVLWQRAGASLDGGVSGSAREWLLSLKQDEARQTQALTRAPRMATGLPPILVSTVKYGPDESGRHALELIDAQGKGEALKLDDSSLYALIRLLDETVEATGWALDLWRPKAPEAGASPAPSAFH